MTMGPPPAPPPGKRSHLGVAGAGSYAVPSAWPVANAPGFVPRPMPREALPVYGGAAAAAPAPGLALERKAAKRPLAVEESAAPPPDRRIVRTNTEGLSHDQAASAFLAARLGYSVAEATAFLTDLCTVGSHMHTRHDLTRLCCALKDSGTSAKTVMRKWAINLISAAVAHGRARASGYTLDLPPPVLNRLGVDVPVFHRLGDAKEYLVRSVLGLSAEVVPSINENAFTVKASACILNAWLAMDPGSFRVAAPMKARD